MKINVDKYENYSIAKISDEKVDSSLSADLKSEFMTLHQGGVKNLILDMEDVKYVDSSGLSAFLVGNRSFTEHGAFVLYNVTDHVMKLITISQIDKVMTVVPSKEEAVDFVFMSTIEKGTSPAE